jgi:hypothetical protein
MIWFESDLATLLRLLLKFKKKLEKGRIGMISSQNGYI